MKCDYPVLDYALRKTLEFSKVKEALKGEEIVKIIYVPGKLINIVTKKEQENDGTVNTDTKNRS